MFRELLGAAFQSHARNPHAQMLKASQYGKGNSKLIVANIMENVMQRTQQLQKRK